MLRNRTMCVLNPFLYLKSSLLSYLFFSFAGNEGFQGGTGGKCRTRELGTIRHTR